jgi:hypothetical protein
MGGSGGVDVCGGGEDGSKRLCGELDGADDDWWSPEHDASRGRAARFYTQGQCFWGHKQAEAKPRRNSKLFYDPAGSFLL